MKNSNVKKIVSVLGIILIITISAILIIINNKTNDEISKNLKNIEILVYDRAEALIYETKAETEEEKLLEALKKIDGLEIESESSEYGEFITSINGQKQEDNYFWNYYINEDYATVGVSQYIIKENDIFKFILEKFE